MYNTQSMGKLSFLLRALQRFLTLHINSDANQSDFIVFSPILSIKYDHTILPIKNTIFRYFCPIRIIHSESAREGGICHI